VTYIGASVVLPAGGQQICSSAVRLTIFLKHTINNIQTSVQSNLANGHTTRDTNICIVPILCNVLAEHVVHARELHGDGDHGFPAVTAVNPR